MNHKIKWIGKKINNEKSYLSINIFGAERKENNRESNRSENNRSPNSLCTKNHNISIHMQGVKLRGGLPTAKVYKWLWDAVKGLEQPHKIEHPGFTAQ